MEPFSLPLIGTREFFVAGNTSPLVHVLGSPLVHVAGNNSPLVHVLRSPLVHVAGNFAGKNSPLVHVAGNFAGKNSPLVHVAGNIPLVLVLGIRLSMSCWRPPNLPSST